MGPAHPFRGGIAAFIERMAREFQAQGHEVVIFNLTKQYPGFLFPGKSQYSIDAPPTDLKILPTLHAFNPLNWPSAARKIARWNPDLILCKFWLPFMGMSFGTLLRMVRRKKKVPVISIIDNIIPHEKRPGDKILSRYFVNTVQGFLVMSRSVQEDMEGFVKKQPVKFLPHPIYDNYGPKVSREKSLEHLGLATDQHYLLFFGFIRGYKGLDLFIRIFAHEKIKALGLKGIIAGEYYEDDKPYIDLIDELQLRDQLILNTDFIPNDEVKYFFGAADLVVLPYKSATQSGITQIAYHFEKPMLLTKVGGLAELVEDGGNALLANPDVDEIAEKVAVFYRDQRRDSMERRCAELKKKFSWDSFNRALLKLYDELSS